MTSSSHLTGRLNLGQIRESYLRDMLQILDSIRGSKCMVWDEELRGPLSTIAELSILKAHGVDQVMRTMVVGMELVTQARNVVFLIRPYLRHMDTIADCVKRSHRARGAFHFSFHIIFVPRDSYLCRQRLEQCEVLGSIEIHQLLIEVFPLDSDLMSMGLENLFRECVVENDHGPLLAVARAIAMLQSLFGVIPNVRGKGPLAKRLFDLMTRLRKELKGKESPVVSQIDTLFLMDRSVDLLSPLATQLTYEGLLDEIYELVEEALLAQFGQVIKFELPPERNPDLALDVLDERGLAGRVQHLHLDRIISRRDCVDEKR
ncbi:vacuolar protein sorting-associated protein 33A-like [Tropilaelaps mercedesae]|uniref:Vacuolar protein sorting-associated protein 33A-like n=1 Tax=Tropilaelaps mercedesae TaxID=418985 RepID=A0A1V9X049_9ACAR|nr:vacuolar protein sorting-associated protein 33A-like [Tropilaelaps mercedesae]